MILLEAVNYNAISPSIYLLAGIIGAAGAAIGGLITGIFSTKSVEKQIEHQKASELRLERKKLYISLCKILFAMTDVLDNMNNAKKKQIVFDCNKKS